MGCCDSDDVQEQNDEPNTVRKCTDVFWLIVYVLFWSLMLLIAVFSFVYGNPIRIINGYDSFGNTCGMKNNPKLNKLELSGMDTSEKPYLVFFDIKHLRSCLKLCVKQCPKENLNNLNDLEAYYKKTQTNLCTYNFNYSDIRDPKITDKDGLTGRLGPCPKLPVYESTPVLNRCVPKPAKDLASGILDGFYDLLNSWDTLEQILGDLYKTWRELLALSFLALIISLFTVSILHLLASLVSYIVMILVTVASVFGTGFLWYTYFSIKYSLDETPSNRILSESVRNETAFFWYSIIATIITVVILILVIVMRKSVDFLADLFKETTKCLVHIPGLFLQPLVTFVILLLFFTFWIFVVLCLATSYYEDTRTLPYVDDTIETAKLTATTTPSSTSLLKRLGNISYEDVKKFTVVEFVDPTWVKYMWWVYFIGLIWTSEFIMACQQMVIAGAVAHWYYRHKYKDNSHVSYAICKLIKYHLGSIALGSLLITIFKIPRLIMMYLYAKLKAKDDAGSECAKCGLKCCICCCFCLEKFIRYLNHNAYTVIAIDGANFCKAAATAFEVLSSHVLQVATINGVGDFILFLGKVFVTCVTGSVGLYFFRLNSDLKFYAAPTLLVCIFAFFIAHCILSLYEMVLDTVYLCMCQNTEPDAEIGIQLQNMMGPPESNGNTNGTSPSPVPELEPMK